MNSLTDIKFTSRNTYGWQGAHGTAYTKTAFSQQLGHRVIVKAEWAPNNCTRLVCTKTLEQITITREESIALHEEGDQANSGKQE